MPMSRFFLFAAVLFFSSSASAQTSFGLLSVGDSTLNSGEFMDEYTVEATVGDTVRAVVTSADFDTYVILVSPSDEQAENDDCTEGETTRSCAEWVADVDGPVRVLVTSFQPGEVGRYEVEVTVTGATNLSDRRDGDL